MNKTFQLVSDFLPAGDQPRAIRQLVDGLKAGEAGLTLLGVTGSGKTFTIAHVIAALQRPALVLAPNKTLAAQLYSEMRAFFPHNAVEYFVSYYDYYQPEAYVPSTNTYIAKDAAIDARIEQMRLAATKALLERPDVLIVATVSSIYGLGDPQAYLRMVLPLSRGEPIEQRTLLRRLADLQYARNDLGFTRGTYRVRGEVIDIYPAEADDEALRVEFFDEEIESLTLFDPLTGQTRRSVARYTVFPKTHYATPRDTLLAAAADIEAELDAHLAGLRDRGKLVEAQRLEERTRFDLEMLREVGYCSGIENYSRHLSGRRPGEPPPTLYDYLPDQALVVIDESHVTVPQLGGMYRGDRSRKETLVEYGFRLPSALDNRPLRFEEFQARQPQTIYVSATPRAFETQHSGAVVEQLVRPTGLVDPEVEVRPARTQVEDLLAEIRRCSACDERVLVTTLTKRLAEDLTDYLGEHDVRVRYLHADVDTVERVEILRDLRLGTFEVLVGINLLREGLDLPEVSLIAILDADKEGFLRSEGALIQTIGRAARNVHGKAILYADQVTGSMARALDETQRRRARQLAHNAAQGIEPRTIRKPVTGLLEDALPKTSARRSRKPSPGTEESVPEPRLSPRQLARQIQVLEKEMRRLARNLEFEQAAVVRDRLQALRQQQLGF